MAKGCGLFLLSSSSLGSGKCRLGNDCVRLRLGRDKQDLAEEDFKGTLFFLQHPLQTHVSQIALPCLGASNCSQPHTTSRKTGLFLAHRSPRWPCPMPHILLSPDIFSRDEADATMSFPTPLRSSALSHTGCVALSTSPNLSVLSFPS